MFENAVDNNLEQAEDRVGGGFSRLESDIYTPTIKAAYGGTSSGGAKFVRFIMDFDGVEHTFTEYVISKKGVNYYERNGKKFPLPGFTVANDICMMANETPLSQQDMENKVIRAYDPEQGKEANIEVPMLVDLIGSKVALGIQKKIEDKYNGEPGETVEVNEINAVFHPEHKVTLREAVNGSEATFWDKWLEANKGKTRDISGKSSSKPAQRPNNSGGNKRTKTLFG